MARLISSSVEIHIGPITNMNEPRIDLNLLTVLQAIMAERSVTRAARRLSMTQPAVSNALRRARGLFNDDLFTKGIGGFLPTERMIEVWPELDRSLNALSDLTRVPQFTPATAKGAFRVAVTDALAFAVVPALAKRFLTEAPNAKLHFHMHTNEGSIAMLDRGDLDCAVGMFPQPPQSLRMRALMEDTYVCVMRADHPLRDGLTLQNYTAARHVLVKQAASSRGIVDIWLELHGRTREIVTIVNRFEDAVNLVADTELLAAIPMFFAKTRADRTTVLIALPFPADRLVYKLIWHNRSNGSASHRWFRNLVSTVVDSCIAGDVGSTLLMGEGDRFDVRALSAT
jgi:DNA-binding transcriptional LysR family regulator